MKLRDAGSDPKKVSLHGTIPNSNADEDFFARVESLDREAETARITPLDRKTGKPFPLKFVGTYGSGLAWFDRHGEFMQDFPHSTTMWSETIRFLDYPVEKVMEEWT
ncbi:hypothetical protein ACWGH7_30750 [Streptomyces cyaneofuscatus]